ncbi:Uncharacterized protein SCF082_LOCUS18987 [Durusdinium trenchii]|uniref:Hemerythrin-like domain-containing protein n=1 Tax=Durusdinium trenchii TaxID=1381693 RepID=A0ABP0KUJ1_9DINO
MGGKASIFNTACAPSACCVPQDQVGNVIVNTPVQTSTKPEFLQPSEEGLSTAVEILEDYRTEADSPETTHPVAVNAFDKLTRIHTQIHKHLEKQEMLIAQLLHDGEGLSAEAFKLPR